jgi:LysM repeat protein
VQSDLDKGSITTVTTANVNGTLSNPVTTTVATVPNRILTLTKSATPTNYDHLGQTLTYTYVITNTGTLAIGPAQFTVSDTGLSVPLNCGNPDTTLASNATVNCSTPYTVTQTDMDTGSVATTATASGGGVGPSQPASATVTKTSTSNLTRGSNVDHIVFDGEWLWQIARCYGANPTAVVKANPQLPNPAMIKAGTKVHVPNIGSDGTIYQTNPPVPCVAKHTVQTGETWNSIALKYNADVNLLKMINANNMAVGIVLKVPLNSYGADIPAPSTPNTPQANTCVDVTRNIRLVGLNANLTHFNFCGPIDATARMDINTIKITQRVEDVGQGGLSQDIVIPANIVTSTPIYDANALVIGDMNYDGNDDFRIIKSPPVGPNVSYIYYLYDPATRTFIYNEAYGKITSPNFPGNNEISSPWLESTVKFGIDTYVISNNTPILTKRETWEAINETQAKHQILAFNADGTSTLTLDEIVPLPEQ